MRASRAVALSALTIGLTVGGIGAAAADAATGGSHGYTSESSSGSGSTSTTAKGVTVDHDASGVTADGHSFDYGTHLKVDLHGVTHCYHYSYSSSHPSEHSKSDHGKSDHGKYGHEGSNGDQQYGHGQRGHGDENEGLLTDVLEDLL